MEGPETFKANTGNLGVNVSTWTRIMENGMEPHFTSSQNKTLPPNNTYRPSTEDGWDAQHVPTNSSSGLRPEYRGMASVSFNVSTSLENQTGTGCLDGKSVLSVWLHQIWLLEWSHLLLFQKQEKNWIYFCAQSITKDLKRHRDSLCSISAWGLLCLFINLPGLGTHRYLGDLYLAFWHFRWMIFGPREGKIFFCRNPPHVSFGKFRRTDIQCDRHGRMKHLFWSLPSFCKTLTFN